MAKTGNLWALVRELGIELRAGSDHSPAASRVRVSYARETLRSLIRQHGECHVRSVLAAILGDRPGARNRAGNAAQLHASTIRAVSVLLLRHPGLVAEGARLLDDVDLGALRLRARAIGTAPTWATMAALLAFVLVRSDLPDFLREAA